MEGGGQSSSCYLSCSRDLTQEGEEGNKIGRNKEDLSGRILRQSFNMHLKWIIKDIYLTLAPSLCFFQTAEIVPSTR